MASEHSESLDTNSTSLVEDSLNISFENINYTVRNILVSCERKTILNDVNGTFNAGELTVIMGPSGSGKSTLMDILSGYTKPTSGNLLVNGRVRNEMMFRRRSCYILQDDIVQDKLTIQESLNIAADLKLGDHISKEQKRLRIEEVIISLRLSEARNIRAEQLSGGQRKRLSIGLELITDPLVMFLDEPTSGLDSSITKDLVYLLHLLARQGRTIVATVHQPSALVLHMVDKLYAIVEGRCAYIGSVPQLLPYLEEIELKCPPYNNPVDFLIEKCDENQNALVEHAENGKSRRWTANISHENDRKLKEKCNIREEVCLTLLPPSHDDPNNKILLALKSTYPTSIWRQFITLTRRSLLTVWRSPLTVLRLTGSHFALALLIGTLLYQIGEDGDNGRMIYNFLFFSLMFVMFTAFSWVSIRFPGEIPVIRREHFNRWYTAEAYCMSTLVCTLPIQTVCTLTYTITAYLLTGQPLEAIRFFRFCFMMLMVSYVALFQGLLIGSACSVKYAVIIGPFCIMPFTIFAGFFLRYVDAPFFLQWLFYLSFLKYGFDGLLLSIFDMKRTNLKCTDIFCYYGHPSQFLHDHGIRNVKYTELVGALFAIAAIIILSAFIMLKIRIKCKW